jgi:predicted metal-dependent peptidase
MSQTLERVKNARVWLSARVPFLGYMTTRLRPRLALPDENVPTAGVAPDGTLVLNDEWVGSLTDPEIRFLIGHEVLHPALEFFARLQSRDLRMFNCAHDFVINKILMDFAATVPSGELKMPQPGLLDSQYDDMSAEEVYNALMEEVKKQPKQEGGFPGGSMSGDCRPDLSDTPEGQQAGKGDQSAQTQLRRMWGTTLEAAAQTHEAQMKQGSLPGSVQQLLRALRDPKVTWQSVLSQWVGENAGKNDFTYQRPARRSESVGEILPGVLKTGLPDVTILWDTSGSMSGMMEPILAEVNEIVSELGLTVRLMVCDAMLHADVDGLNNVEDIAKNLKGGGGSDFNPAFDVLSGEGNTSVVVAFTDGYINVPQSQPETLKGVLWCLTERGHRPTTWGRAIALDSEGYAEEV